MAAQRAAASRDEEARSERAAVERVRCALAPELWDPKGFLYSTPKVNPLSGVISRI